MHAWLTDEHEDQMLDLLWREMVEDGISASADLKNMQYALKLKDAYQNRSQYMTELGFQWLQVTGEVLAGGTQHKQGLIANINKNHWVAVVLDFKNHLILYSNSLREPPN